MSEKYYLTTAIAYASRKPHFGNTYEIIMSDAVARYQRACGKDVYFCTGTDEHGQKIENLANERGITPKLYVDGVAGEIKGIWDQMNSSYDYFIRTLQNTSDDGEVTFFAPIDGDAVVWDWDGDSRPIEELQERSPSLYFGVRATKGTAGKATELYDQSRKLLENFMNDQKP